LLRSARNPSAKPSLSAMVLILICPIESLEIKIPDFHFEATLACAAARHRDPRGFCIVGSLEKWGILK
jgi:hypothetical protein